MICLIMIAKGQLRAIIAGREPPRPPMNCWKLRDARLYLGYLGDLSGIIGFLKLRAAADRERANGTYERSGRRIGNKVLRVYEHSGYYRQLASP